MAAADLEMRISAHRWLIVIAVAGVSVPLHGQCPDGSPPPCDRAAARPTPAANSVAVLYFQTEDTADTYLANGLTEDIATLLGDMANVQVKSPGVVRHAQRATPQDLAAIARALGVRYLVDGTVRRTERQLRITVRLVAAGTAVSKWGQIYDRAPDELLALPPVIAREVATRVAGTVAAPAGSFGALRTRSPAAYDHFLRGNFLLGQRTPEFTAQAIGEYREAERLDSTFTAAIGRAAYAYAIARSNYYRLPDTPIESLVVRGLSLVDRALHQDSTSSDVWMARGYLLAFAHPRTMDSSLDAFQRAITLDPKNAEAHHQYGQVLAWLGRLGDADREYHQALALDPSRMTSYNDLSYAVHFRDTARAVALADSAVTLDPMSRRTRASARLVAGDVQGALEDAELANRLRPGNIVTENTLAIVLARAGNIDSARALIAHWPGRTDNYMAMAALVAVGDTAAALDRFERAQPDPSYWAYLHRPEFDALHGNRRYERLLATLRPSGAVGP